MEERAEYELTIATLKGHGDDVWSVAFSPDGRTLASGSWDKTIKLWDVASPKEIATLKGHGDDVWSVAFSPDGKTLASGSCGSSGTIKWWDLASGDLAKIRYYGIKRGDTLQSIARKFYGDEGKASDIMTDNNLSSLDAIKVGWVLKIRKPTKSP